MRVLVVGGGASGVSTALTLKELNAEVEVELWEPRPTLGGMASSARTPEGEWYNNGVQGIHASFVHTRALLASAGFPESTMRPTSLTSCFVTPTMTWISGVTDMTKYKRSIKCFKRMCAAVRRTPVFYGIWTIVDACIFFAVSRSFVNNVVLPTLALFFGTGNQVAKLPAPLGAQVFYLGGNDTNRALTVFDLDMQHFIVTARNNMLALPPLVHVYAGIDERLRAAGVTVRLNQTAGQLVEADGHVMVMSSSGQQHPFDKVVMATQVPDALLCLPPQHKARNVLKKVRYFHDISVTHRDTAHMEAHFDYKPDMRINYFIHERSPQSMDMGFALHRYQRVTAPLYQTLWLQGTGKQGTGKQGEPDRAAPIAPNLVLREDHWYQLGHTVSHFVNCVTKLKKIQGPAIYFAGSWTLVNSHEVAVMSGIRAAQHVLQAYSTFPVRTFGPVSDSFKAYAKILDGKPT